MKKKQFVIFSILVIAVVFLVATVSVPRISAQDGITVRSRMVSDQDISRNVSLDITAAKLTSHAVESKFVFQAESSGISYTMPYLVSIQKPILYPKSAIRKELEGEAIVALEILADGSVGRAGLAKSSGSSLLDQAALQTVRTWEFAPALKNGKPVVEYIKIPVKFKLEND